MNLEIGQERSKFYQWDTGHRLIVTDGGVCKQVHFKGEGSVNALVCQIKETDGIRWVEVPNILLQSDRSITAFLWCYDENGSQTRYAKNFAVLPRPRPESYVYTETEVLNYTYLDNRLKHLEGEGLAEAVADYFEQNPIEGGASPEEVEQIHQNKEDIAQLTQNKLDADKLPQAVNDALTQAKASGAFDGQDGRDGTDGYTPQKGIDYFDGVDGKPGEPGTSLTHRWNGTELVITSASGTSSADLKGEIGIKWMGEWEGDREYNKGDAVFYNGAPYYCLLASVSSGITPGISQNEWAMLVEKGKTPVKGVDYFTEVDKAEMVEEVKNSGVLMYTEQVLTEEQMYRARENIGAASKKELGDAASFAVTITETDAGLVSDRTPDEIANAYAAGRYVYGYMDGVNIPFVGSDSKVAIFCATQGTESTTLTVFQDQTVQTEVFAYVTEESLPDVINAALAEAKASGAFKGDPGAKGDKGDTGATGPAYTLTTADKNTIVNSVIAALPTWTGGSY